MNELQPALEEIKALVQKHDKVPESHSEATRLATLMEALDEMYKLSGGGSNALDGLIEYLGDHLLDWQES